MSYELPVAMSFHRGDWELAHLNLEWQLELDGERSMESICLTFDSLVPRKAVDKMTVMAGRVYRSVSRHEYPAPNGYSLAQNQAFSETAVRMSRQDKSWFWMEADCIPLTKGWLQTLSARYHRAGKKFFCPRIPDLGHYNGTGVYPKDTPNLIPRALQNGAGAWDVKMTEEIRHQVADAMGTLFHAWTINGGVMHPSEGGQVPHFDSRELLRQIPPSAVLFHRCKDLSLITMLSKIKNEHEQNAK